MPLHMLLVSAERFAKAVSLCDLPSASPVYGLVAIKTFVKLILSYHIYFLPPLSPLTMTFDLFSKSGGVVKYCTGDL